MKRHVTQGQDNRDTPRQDYRRRQQTTEAQYPNLGPTKKSLRTEMDQQATRWNCSLVHPYFLLIDNECTAQQIWQVTKRARCSVG